MSKRALLIALLPLLSFACKSKEEILQEERENGQFAVEKKAELVHGIGEGLKGKGSEGMEALTEGVGEVFKGAAKGFDQSLTAVKIKSADGLAQKGLQFQRAGFHDRGENQKTSTISAYIVFDQAFTGKLQLRAMADATTEVGRVNAEVKEDAGAARYVDFDFDERVPVRTAEHFVLVAL